MKIQYQLKGQSELFDSIEQLKDYFCWMVDNKNPKWVENNVVEIDIHSDEYIMRDIPKEFHGTLSYMAYEKGHAYGYDEVRNILMGLVDDLKKPIKNFEQRLRDDLSN